MKTINIKELGIEVEKEIHNKGETLPSIKIPKGWRLLKVEEIIFLFNNEKYKKLLNLDNTWEFIEQSFNLNKEKGYVAGFGAASDRAFLGFDRGSASSGGALGVRFCRDLK
jgi:hypothetical protein